ncbi:MAG: 5-formyltetrahydrofolate cyclo-ligase [Betaproteobacteria bacterium]|nr:5-formyltetrahydrofolate cyclo-ligase [Betaproteobacteria bacterium]
MSLPDLRIAHAHPNLQPEKPVNSSAIDLDGAERSSALRRDKIAAREALAPDLHRRLSLAIETHLTLLLQRCQPRVLGFCWPFRAEFDCRALAARLVNEGVRACLPQVISADAALEFRAWRPDSEMLVDRYGIHYPAAGETLTPDVLLLPVNAFDAAGYRLGYGAGYFDRTLAQLAGRGQCPLTIGVGFELARVESIHPAAHDIPLDAVVTETRTTQFSTRLLG